VAKGPRTIDLDLLLVGAVVIDEPGPPALRLPHPALTDRAFVLRPLAELGGAGLCIPGRGVTVGECLERSAVAGQRVTRET
jgi:2-amino-4-hydroxy-6-hydroxymethyldihydropteridine diphosphokinase